MSTGITVAAPKKRRIKGDVLSAVLRAAVIVAAVLTVCTVVFMVAYILIMGVPHLSPDLFSVKYTTDNVSLFPALINTLTMIALTLLFALPIGIGSAVYLTEYAKRGNPLVGAVRITAETLSGIPSIVYGLFGSLFFVKACKAELSILSGALTLSLMILPLIMRTTEEALSSVSDSLREGSFGLGAGKLRTVFRITLPSAMPGIFSGVILGIGRIIGESAALIFTAGTVPKIAKGLFSSGRTLAVHMYSISGEGLYINQTYACAVVLLLVVIVINALSGLISRRLGGS